MHAVIIGAGLIGVTSAWYLQQSGWEVTVIDRRDGVGMETSFANGGILTPSLSDPWNSPGFWKILLANLGREDSPLLLRPKALPALLGWGITFLRNSAPPRYRANALANFALACHSRQALQALRDELTLDFDHADRGTLKLFRDGQSLERRARDLDFLRDAGLQWDTLNPSRCVALEPALADIERDIAGGLHFPGDQSGDAFRFCRALAHACRARGVAFRFGTAVTGFAAKGGQIRQVLTADGGLDGDIVVLAAGSYSRQLARSAGLRLPVAPVKGYSLTVPLERDVPRPRLPVLDDALRATATPLGDRLRVAGTAEFAGYDNHCRRERVRNLHGLLAQIYPAIETRLDASAVSEWCGLRPMSGDGVPLVGPSSIPNLYINAGHGHLGWSMAAGSGQLLNDIVAGRQPAIDVRPYRPGRFRGC